MLTLSPLLPAASPALLAAGLELALTLVLAAAVLALLAVAMGFVLGWANRAFAVEVDPKVEAIEEALPGANCGGCGFVGCSEYAVAVAAGKAPTNLCAPGGAACTRALADIMGVEAEESYPLRAVVHCAATTEQKLQRWPYDGEQTCAAANLVAGVQGCTYGCLGLGDCERACSYDAIHVRHGRAEVDYERCVGCRACERVCPRNIITMVPFKTNRMLVVACSNKDFAKDVKAVCKIGCLGCSKCTKKSSLLKMGKAGKLPEVDYEHYDPAQTDFRPALEACPMQRLVYVGKPTPEEKAAAGEPLPEPVTADFKTTVDDAEWRG